MDVPKELGEIGISCVRLEDCAGCQEPCDDLGSFPPKWDIDTVSQLFGTTKPYRRQVGRPLDRGMILSTVLEYWHDLMYWALWLASGHPLNRDI